MSGNIDLAPDVVVIGAGLAGFVAAARAKERGLRVTLVERAGGATSASSGAIDIADELCGLVPGPALEPLERGGRWRKAVDVVSAAQPRHPYARVGAAGRDRIREAIAFLKELARGVDLVERDDGTNHVVTTQLGTIKRAALVQRSQLLDVASLAAAASNEPALIGVMEPLDFAGFNAAPVAHMLAYTASLGTKPIEVRAYTVGAVCPSVCHTPAELGHALDADAPRAAFIDALRTALRAPGRVPTHLLFPPVLGVARTLDIVAELEKATGKVCREVLALPPSLPAERLMRALREALVARGVVIVAGTVQAARVAGGRMEALVVDGPRARVELRPRAAVLASGRFLGGGIVRDHVAKEPVFDLPVVTGGAPIADTFIGQHLGQGPEQAHAIFRAGLDVDADLRPLALDGTVALRNVVCAGTVIAGYDPARDGTGAAVAALTGFLAGDRAAAAAQQAA